MSIQNSGKPSMPSAPDPDEVHVAFFRGEVSGGTTVTKGIEADEDRHLIGWSVQNPTNLANSNRLIIDAWLGGSQLPSKPIDDFDTADGDASVNFLHSIDANINDIGNQIGIAKYEMGVQMLPPGTYFAWEEDETLSLKVKNAGNSNPGVEVQFYYLRRSLD